MKKTHEQFLKDLSKKNNKVEVISEYKGATEYILAKCVRCGYEWNVKAYSLLNGRACPKCRVIRGIENNKGKTRKKTPEEFVKELSKIDNSIEVISSYKGHHSNVMCKCKICNSKWETKAYSLLQGHGCQRCAKSGTSFMEQFIRLSYIYALGETEILSRDKKTIGMELDIYIPKLNIAIEPGNWNLHKKNLKRDFEKRELCRKKNIRLITIYDKFPINQELPFKTDCIVFNDDYNKANHTEIKNLVRELFKLSNINICFNEDIWENIEKQAYINSKAKTHEDFLEEMKQLHPNIKVISKYQNSNLRILVECLVCGYKWNAVPANLLSGDGCRKCGTKKAHKKFIKDLDLVLKEIEEKNKNVEIIGEYTGRHNKIKTRCKICGFEWKPVYTSLLRGSSHKGATEIHKKINKI